MTKDAKHDERGQPVTLQEFKRSHGAQYTISVPRVIVRSLGLRKGQRLGLRLENGLIVLEPLDD